MKKVILFLSLLLIAVSCTEEPLDTMNAETPLSRAVVPNGSPVSVSNPQLISNWENQTEIALNTEVASGQPMRVTAPWADGVSSVLTEEFRKDVRKDDGWTMLFHTFKESGLDPGQNFICLYNMFTGFLKVFYYYEDPDATSHSYWRIRRSTAQCHLLENPVEVFTPIGTCVNSANMHIYNNESYENNPTTNDTIPPHLFAPGWNGFQFHVDRYLQSSDNVELTIDVIGEFELSHSLTGKGIGNLHGIMNSITSTSPNVFKGVSEGRNESLVEDAYKQAIENHRNGLIRTGIDAAASLAGLIGGSGVKNLIGGLKVLFPKTIESYYSTSQIQISQTMDITMTGSSSTTLNSKVTPLTFNLNNVLRQPIPVATPGTEIRQSPSIVTPVIATEPMYLGVWTLKQNPIVYYNPYTHVELNPNSSLDGKQVFEFIGSMPYPTATRTEVDVEFNPIAKRYLKSYFVQVHLLESSSPLVPSSFRNIRFNQELSLGNNIYPLDVHSGSFDVLADWSREQYTEDTELYWHWNSVGTRPTVAMVELNMVFQYKGNDINVVETRYYMTQTAMETDIDTSKYNNMPKACVINENDKCWVLNWSY